MKNRILIGCAIAGGGNIIIPVDMAGVETITPMTRNRSAIRKPVSKPRRDSES